MRSAPISWQNIPQGHPAPPGQVAPTADQFRASLQRHLDTLIEEEEKMARDDKPVDLGAYLIHDYAASLLRELKAWAEVS